MTRYILLFLLLTTSPLLQANSYTVKVGTTKVVIKHLRHKKGKVFVHLHQNETTALTAAKHVVKTQGGSLLTLVHPGKRNITFYLHKKRYEFDPNRIFTDKGIKKTLNQYGHYSKEAHAVVKKLAAKIKGLLPKNKEKIVAVHNNTESYSLKKYLPGKKMSKDARLINYHDKPHARNFFLVTRRQDFVRLKKMHFNSVLQSPRVTDDGSLSVYLAHANYINVEAGCDQLGRQIKMLKHA